MKTIYLLLGILALLAACSSPPDDLASAVIMEHEPVDNTMGGMTDDEMDAMMDDGIHEMTIDPAKSTFTFEGYGPGKSHVGTFQEMSGTITMEMDGTITASEGTIQTASVKSDSDGLDNHLKNEDFFDVERYPTITWKSNSINDEEMIGELTFLGVTRTITIPIIMKENSLSADFLLDTSQFGMSYAGVNDEVRIAFAVRP